MFCRTATLAVTPGEPVYGVVLGPLRPGTTDNDHKYAVIRRVADNHVQTPAFAQLLGAGRHAAAGNSGNGTDTTAG
jgi:hypothetical protein